MVICAGPKFRAQTGMDSAIQLLANSVDRFNEAATTLILTHGTKSDEWRDLDLFIMNCRSMCYGRLHWRSVFQSIFISEHQVTKYFVA